MLFNNTYWLVGFTAKLYTKGIQISDACILDTYQYNIFYQSSNQTALWPEQQTLVCYSDTIEIVNSDNKFDPALVESKPRPEYGTKKFGIQMVRLFKYWLVWI